MRACSSGCISTERWRVGGKNNTETMEAWGESSKEGKEGGQQGNLAGEMIRREGHG